MSGWLRHGVGIAGGLLAVVAMSARKIWTGGRFHSPKYMEFGGAIRELVHAVITFAVAYVFFSVLASDIFGTRPDRWAKDRNLLVGTGMVVLYMLYLANSR